MIKDWFKEFYKHLAWKVIRDLWQSEDDFRGLWQHCNDSTGEGREKNPRNI